MPATVRTQPTEQQAPRKFGEAALRRCRYPLAPDATDRQSPHRQTAPDQRRLTPPEAPNNRESCQDHYIPKRSLNPHFKRPVSFRLSTKTPGQVDASPPPEILKRSLDQQVSALLRQ